MNINIAAIILAFLFGILATLGLLRFKREYDWRIENLSKQVRELIEQVKLLQESNARRLPYRAAEEIENATAALNYLMFQSRLDQDAVQNALNHLMKARNPGKNIE